MNKLFIAILILFSVQFTEMQDRANVVKIKYSSTARSGYVEEITVTKDSIKISEFNRRNPSDGNFYCSKIKKKEWAKYLNAISDIDILTISELESPTHKRMYDGAKHSEISIITSDGNKYTHLFDDENPHTDFLGTITLLLEQKNKK